MKRTNILFIFLIFGIIPFSLNAQTIASGSQARKTGSQSGKTGTNSQSGKSSADSPSQENSSAQKKSPAQNKSPEQKSPPIAPADWPFIIGADEGLYGMDQNGNSAQLWTAGSVQKILHTDSSWFIRSSEGIFSSTDLVNWEKRSEGLPVKTIKLFQDGKKSFVQTVQEIKDLEINPANSEILVCATKDNVYLSRNGGLSWKNIGAPSFRTNGIKAVGVGNFPDLTVFLSHSIYGLFYINPDAVSPQWTELNDGLETLETTGNADEVSDIAVVLPFTANGAADSYAIPSVYVSQTFRSRIYSLDWNAKRFSLLWKGDGTFGTVDSLEVKNDRLLFIREGAAADLSLTDPLHALLPRTDILDLVHSIPEQLNVRPASLIIQDKKNGGADETALSELWLLDKENLAGRDKRAMNHEGLYLPVNHAMDSESLKPYLDIISERGLDMIVIDMKDDYGRLRFTPNNPAIAEKGRVFRPLDIDTFLAGMKARGIYTAARIVVFKDPELAKRAEEKYAIWDAASNKAWTGYYMEDGEKKFYDEQWVDPYSEEVWEYIAATAEELHSRGFDEIQFDYIRFPTDGINLSNIKCRAQDPGMDMESAIVSFLRHIRRRIDAPISIDIYGANGWYRTGARTGQEVELLAPWVDVISPMYYPSHFEQDFLAQSPAEMRPYRIYFQGTQRTSRIGRGRIIVRPYVQAFYLNVSYDRKYYDTDYVRREVEGVRAAGNGGLTYWNNSGRYDDIP
ncbi:MAG: hypothetical protein LBN21_04555 [Treponema sp.]|nr:hypothetical protein [Treponema sp.]